MVPQSKAGPFIGLIKPHALREVLLIQKFCKQWYLTIAEHVLTTVETFVMQLDINLLS